MIQPGSQNLSQMPNNRVAAHDRSDNCCRSVSSCCLTTLRCILIIICLIFFLFLILLLIIIAWFAFSSNPMKLSLPASLAGSFTWLIPLLLLPIPVLGCCGAFYQHALSLKIFTLLMVIGLAYEIITFLSSGGIDGEIAALKTSMDNLMKDYNWSYDKDPNTWNTATKAWNYLQELGCCGMNGPQDWDKFHPLLSTTVYPRTCCPGSPSSCDTYARLYTTGCSERLESKRAILATFHYGPMGFLLVLATLGCILGFMGSDKTRAAAPIVVESATINLSPAYPRASVPGYVSQQPVNPNSEPKVPSLYPTVATVQEKYSGPPPVYTSGQK